MTENLSPSDWLAALWDTHGHLERAVNALNSDDLTGPSYDTEWTIAQVLSHLGSGAEIFPLLLAAGVNDEPAPGMDAFQAIWANWDAKTPEQQAADALVANRSFLEQVDALDEDARDSWSLEFFGERRTLRDLLWFRLAELSVHVWDVVVMREESASLAPASVALLIDVIGNFAARVGKAPDVTLTLRIDTSEPTRSFNFTADGGQVLLESGSSDTGEGRLTLPSEALIRLVYGRLDPSHTPTHQVDGVELAELRGIFPGV